MKKIIMWILIPLLAIGLVSCYRNAFYPPSIQSVEDQLLDNYEELSLIKDFFLQSGYSSIYIHSANGYMFADMKNILIPDDNVREIIKALIADAKYSVIIKDGNTIWFQQWTRFTDAGAGLAYSPSETELNKIQYLTEYEPLSEVNWYYYVDDYNEWRSSSSTGDGSVC